MLSGSILQPPPYRAAEHYNLISKKFSASHKPQCETCVPEERKPALQEELWREFGAEAQRQFLARSCLSLRSLAMKQNMQGRFGFQRKPALQEELWREFGAEAQRHFLTRSCLSLRSLTMKQNMQGRFGFQRVSVQSFQGRLRVSRQEEHMLKHSLKNPKAVLLLQLSAF